MFMPINSKRIQYVLLIIAGFFAQCIAYAAISYKYSWFLDPKEDEALSIIIFIMLGGCAALWILFPSRLAIGVITGICLVAPAFIDLDDYSFRYPGMNMLNVPTIAVFCVVIMLLVGIAHWRQKIDRLPRN